MREYKILKDGTVDTSTTKEELKIGEVHPEWLVDSLCSLNFDKSINCEDEIYCIDCLVKCGVVELVVK